LLAIRAMVLFGVLAYKIIQYKISLKNPVKRTPHQKEGNKF